jgi:hypothetical protein
MRGVRMIREILCVSSGTMARLIGSDRYDDVDAAVARWVGWVDARPETERWDSWRDCWEAFRAASA